MLLAFLVEPSTMRIALPIALAVGYACYHWWRWVRMHPKIVLEDLPMPAAEAHTVVRRTPKPAPRWTPGLPTEAAQPEDDGDVPVYKMTNRPLPQGEEVEEEEPEADAYDPDCHEHAYNLAHLGMPEYFVRLAEYAWERGAMIEAHYWLSVAKFNGVAGLEEWLECISQRWIEMECPPEMENEYDQYPFECAELARAWIMMCNGFDEQENREFLEELAQGGNPDAQLFLESLDEPQEVPEDDPQT